MFPMNEAAPDGFDAEVPFTFLLGLKELILFTMILSFGFGGFSLCYDKIYQHDFHQESIANVTIYSPEIDQAYMTIASQSYVSESIK
jgi:hypothetical protein